MTALRRKPAIHRRVVFAIALLVSPTGAILSTESFAAEKATKAASLIACPDCGHEVSRRAVACPACGCPGAAITQALLAEELVNRPLPLVEVRSDIGTGQGVVISDSGFTFVLVGADIVAGASSLELGTLSKKETVSYTRLEIAADAPLVRLAIASDSVRALRLGSGPSSNGTRLLLKTGTTSSLLDGHQLPAAAVLDREDKVLALITDTPAPAAHDVNDATEWLPVQPAEYRAQTALLRSIPRPDPAHPLSAADRARLEATVWLSPYLKKNADALQRATPTQP